MLFLIRICGATQSYNIIQLFLIANLLTTTSTLPVRFLLAVLVDWEQLR